MERNYFEKFVDYVKFDEQIILNECVIWGYFPSKTARIIDNSCPKLPQNFLDAEFNYVVHSKLQNITDFVLIGESIYGDQFAMFYYETSVKIGKWFSVLNYNIDLPMKLILKVDGSFPSKVIKVLQKKSNSGKTQYIAEVENIIFEGKTIRYIGLSNFRFEQFKEKLNLKKQINIEIKFAKQLLPYMSKFYFS